jgi:hypothetical protein
MSYSQTNFLIKPVKDEKITKRAGEKAADIAKAAAATI